MPHEQGGQRTYVRVAGAEIIDARTSGTLLDPAGTWSGPGRTWASPLTGVPSQKST